MGLIKCVDCGKEVSDGVRYCPNCGCQTFDGKEIVRENCVRTRVCPSCNSEEDINNKECHNCGFDIDKYYGLLSEQESQLNKKKKLKRDLIIFLAYICIGAIIILLIEVGVNEYRKNAWKSKFTLYVLESEKALEQDYWIYNYMLTNDTNNTYHDVNARIIFNTIPKSDMYVDVHVTNVLSPHATVDFNLSGKEISDVMNEYGVLYIESKEVQYITWK